MYTTRQITDESYSDIQELSKLSFGSSSSLESIERKYDTEIFGLRNIGVLGESDTNEISAYYGVFPIRLEYDGKTYLVAQSGDTMTSPKHRKKGLFVRLAKETYELCKANGIKLVFGFPNEFSYPGFKRKLDWVFYGFMQQFTFSVITIPFCELAAKFSTLQLPYDRFVLSRISKYRIELDEINFDLFNRQLSKGWIKRDRDFFKYKLKRRNSFVVNVNSIQLLVKADVHLFVGEVGLVEDLSPELLLEAVQKLARRLCCKKVVFNVSENHWLFNVLSVIAIAEESLPIGFYVIDEALDPSKIQFSNADYDTF